MLQHKKILIVSDNAFLIGEFHSLMQKHKNVTVDYTCSASNNTLLASNNLPVKISPILLKQDWQKLVINYDLVFSLHCKQLFPSELVKKIKCINIHPGYNPYNRGWFPQVFSILNGMKAGATIHEIDEQLDHGNIIAQKEVEIEKWDTSFSAYSKIQQAEVELLKENLENILNGNYNSYLPEHEGNLNLKKDFNSLREIDLNRKTTMNEAIDFLRAMTHGEYKNAFFIDAKTGKKIYITIDLHDV